MLSACVYKISRYLTQSVPKVTKIEGVPKKSRLTFSSLVAPEATGMFHDIKISCFLGNLPHFKGNFEKKTCFYIMNYSSGFRRH